MPLSRLFHLRFRCSLKNVVILYRLYPWMVRALFARTVHDSCGDSMIDEYVSDDTDFFDFQRNKCLNK